ncbi:hypothetical protein SAMN05192575_109151 [Nocardioides alpinus]|uniref:Uncharacterized protein n=1 Tax=Nocardioides alpinus TaxID=748909 RepID=A0A1I1AL30_9ACTN|nr:hypothetical protein [Nocardioides alpinus]PKH41724.1 hypothetical protein CXG46_07545 [Nocardioides alpinus]SFB38657.1 hypothetical protein SAMN05192575_109151 [Nocardioides alpinus]
MNNPIYATAEGLRLLLLDLAYAGQGAWENDPDAAELMAYAMDKYGALAHKYGLEPTDAATYAFEIMNARATRLAEDPWAVITHAVHLSLVYESRARGLLCSTQQARHSSGSNYHDAERFSERDDELANYHPAFQIEDDFSAIDDPAQESIEDEPTNAYFALDLAIQFFVELGWSHRTARLGLEYIAARLIRTGTRLSAFESLRRDGNGPALLDVDHRSWLAVLRGVLGNQHRDRSHTSEGRGILLRLMSGEGLDELFEDVALARLIEHSAPEYTPASPGRV